MKHKTPTKTNYAEVRLIECSQSQGAWLLSIWWCRRAGLFAAWLGLTQRLLQTQWQQLVYLVRVGLWIKIKLLSDITNHATSISTQYCSLFAKSRFLDSKLSLTDVILYKFNNVVVVMTSPSRAAYMGGQRCTKEMRNSTRLWIRRDPSLPRDSWQPFYWLGHHWRAAVIAHSWHTVDRCQTMDVDKLSNCSRLSDSVVGFTGQKTQPTASKYWIMLIVYCCYYY